MISKASSFCGRLRCFFRWRDFLPWKFFISIRHLDQYFRRSPRRYSAASLVKELEKRNLGNKATRAAIVETLYSRGYAREKSIEVTELGMRMVETLEKYAPIILNEGMTANMTQELEKISIFSSSGERGARSEERDELAKMKNVILDDSKKIVTKIAEGMSANIDAMGKSLADANAIVWEQEKEANTMTECPVCHKGKLRVMYGKRFSRYFVSCDAYPDCKTIYSLPPKGQMRPARRKVKEGEEGDGEVGEEVLDMCGDCGFPLVQSFQRGKAPWKFCFNMECVSNEEARKKKEEFKAKMASGEVEIVDGKIVDHTRKAKTSRGDGKRVTGNGKTGSAGRKAGKRKVKKK